MPSEHAKLSASGSKRWLACPGSIALEKKFPDEDSEYAAEGTRAHTLAEISLRCLVLETVRTEDYHEALAKADSDEMRRAVETYVEYCAELYDGLCLKYKDVKAFVEERVHYDKFAPEGFGTIDFIIVGGREIHTVDYKHGKGVSVDAEDNSQLRYYGLGAIQEYGDIYDFDMVTAHIVQPRLNNIVSQSYTVAELLKWGEDNRAAAQKAFDEVREFEPGEHCRFCKARAVCRTRAEKAIADDFDQDPDMLTSNEIAALLPRLDELESYAKHLKEYALKSALNGEKYEGYKVVEGKSNRKYSDEDKVAKTLIENGYNEALLYERKLLGITAMESLVSKKRFNALLSGLVIKPPGKPALAPISDSRPEYTPKASAADDFDD